MAKTSAIRMITAITDPILGTTYTSTPVIIKEEQANAYKAYQAALTRTNKAKIKAQHNNTKNK